MDVRSPVDEAIEQAKKEHAAGNYKGAVALLRPLLQTKAARDKLTPQQEVDAVCYMSACNRGLLDFKAALPHSAGWTWRCSYSARVRRSTPRR